MQLSMIYNSMQPGLGNFILVEELLTSFLLIDVPYDLRTKQLSFLADLIYTQTATSSRYYTTQY